MDRNERLATITAVDLNCANILLQDPDAFVATVRVFKTVLRLANEGTDLKIVEEIINGGTVDEVSDEFLSEMELERHGEGVRRKR